VYVVWIFFFLYMIASRIALHFPVSIFFTQWFDPSLNNETVFHVHLRDIAVGEVAVGMVTEFSDY
jgi:hypothetical protein